MSNKPKNTYTSTLWACFTPLKMVAIKAKKGDKHVRYT